MRNNWNCRGAVEGGIRSPGFTLVTTPEEFVAEIPNPIPFRWFSLLAVVCGCLLIIGILSSSLSAHIQSRQDRPVHQGQHPGLHPR